VRILYHHRTLADGAEGVHIAAVVDAFRSLGHEVRVVGVGAGGAPSGQPFVARVRAAMPRVFFEGASLALNVAEYAATAREIRRFEPDLLYKRHARFDVGALAAARAHGVPSVLEVNCLFSQPPYVSFEPMSLRRIAASLERRALGLATITIAVSSPLAAIARSFASVRVDVVPNGADLTRFDPARADGTRTRQRYALPNRLVVGWVGVLRDWHGLDLLVDAVRDVPDAHLLIVGDGPQRSAIETRIAGLGLADRVTITGRVPHDDMPDHVAAMDVAVVAGERTGVASPMKLLEYMAMGKPVAAPALENIRDVVENGVTGMLFQPGDKQDLLTALTAMAGDPALRARLGSRARQSIEAGRTWPQIARRILALVESRVEETGSARVTAR
jgi:glycosyltransferase involved in cell wall biosynthesis